MWLDVSVASHSVELWLVGGANRALEAGHTRGKLGKDPPECACLSYQNRTATFLKKLRQERVASIGSGPEFPHRLAKHHHHRHRRHHHSSPNDGDDPRSLNGLLSTCLSVRSLRSRAARCRLQGEALRVGVTEEKATTPAYCQLLIGRQPWDDMTPITVSELSRCSSARVDPVCQPDRHLVTRSPGSGTR